MHPTQKCAGCIVSLFKEEYMIAIERGGLLRARQLDLVNQA